MRAVILAGGEGKRLRPYTQVIPKPLLPINGKPVLELIFENLRNQGIRDITLATNYKSYLFETLFGDGLKIGLNINYLKESKPLGTAGPLKLLKDKIHEDFFVMNGDLITDLNIKEMKKNHKENNADVSLVTRKIEVPVNYGVMETENKKITGWTEKPTIEVKICTGMYMLNPRVLRYIPEDEFYNMDELVKKVISEGGNVVEFLHEGQWIDIGKIDDFEKAQELCRINEEINVFLVSPDERNFLRDAGDRPPLGIMYISSALTKNNINNEIFDLNHFDVNVFLEKVKSEKPGWIGLSVISSPCYKQMRELGEKIKIISPKTKIMVGGAHVTAMPESFEGIADAIIVGNGEVGSIKAIQGVRGIISEEVNINDFAIPDRDKLDSNKYSMYTQDYETGKNLRTATMMTSRGCPFSCIFCASHEKKVQFRNPENVRQEVKKLKQQGYEAVYIFDENFVVKKEHFETIIDIFKEEQMKYRIEMRSTDVNEDVVRRLKNSGCISVALGIESGNDKILQNINKGTTVESNKNAIELFSRYNLHVKGFFIIGLPGETEETARKTIEFAEEFRNKGLGFADFYSLTPFPGSPIWNNPEMYGIKILSKNFDDYLQKGEPVIETENLSKNRIKEIVEAARARWQKLGRIIVTGSSGFLGKRLVEELGRKYEIITFDKDEGKNIENMSDFDGLFADKIIHLAALTKNDNELEMFNVNVNGTLNVLEYCKKTGNGLVFVSSASVYGDSDSQIREDTPVNPKSFYGLTKAIAEKLCEHYNKKFGVNVIILRLFNPYGKGQQKGFLIPDIISQLENESINLGNPYPKRDLVYVDDVIDAIKKSIAKNSFEIFNVGSGESHSVMELVEKIVKGTKQVNFSDNNFINSNSYADINKAREFLGWEPKVSLDEGLMRILNIK
ncbi:MAG: sugar phosphate nucleotidyltransferase [archaeon]